MSDTSGISLTFKAGTGFDAPWVVIHGDNVDDAGRMLEEVRAKGVFNAVRLAAQEFQTGAVSEAQAIQTVQNAFPGAQVVTQPAPPTTPPGQPYQQPQQPQGNLNPACPDCGGPTQFKSGNGSRGPYQAYFCTQKPQGAKGHAIWL